MTHDCSRAGFTAMLMAGGRSVRMGRDKARLLWLGRPLWQVQAEKLAGTGGDPVVIACRHEQKLHESASTGPALCWRFDPDGVETGPAGVVVRVLAEFNRPVLLLAVDMPFMPAAFLNESIVMAADPRRGLFFQSRHGIEPLAGWYAPVMLPVMQACIADGRYGLRGMIHECVAQGLAALRPLERAEEAFFTNINTPVQWDAAACPPDIRADRV